MGEYLDALFREIDWAAEHFKGRKLNTIYIGGGTPTSLSPELLDRLLTKVSDSFDFSDLQEFTVEGGRPDSITTEKLQVLKKHPVTRISINPQTMQEETLRRIGRQSQCRGYSSGLPDGQRPRLRQHQYGSDSRTSR